MEESIHCISYMSTQRVLYDIICVFVRHWNWTTARSKGKSMGTVHVYKWTMTGAGSYFWDPGHEVRCLRASLHCEAKKQAMHCASFSETSARLPTNGPAPPHYANSSSCHLSSCGTGSRANGSHRRMSRMRRDGEPRRTCRNEWHSAPILFLEADPHVAVSLQKFVLDPT